MYDNIKSIYEMLYFFNAEEREKILKELAWMWGDNWPIIIEKKLNENKPMNIKSFIDTTFNWDNTLDGTGYWLDLFRKYEKLYELAEKRIKKFKVNEKN